MSDLIAELEACRRGDVPAAHDSAATVIVPPVARQKPHRARRAFRGVVITLIAVAVVVAAAVGAYVLTKGASNATGIGNGSGSSAGKAVLLRGVTAYDPNGSPVGEEHNDKARLAADGDPTTYWYDRDYRGGLNKSGVGVVLDAGSPKKIRTMTVTTDTRASRPRSRPATWRMGASRRSQPARRSPAQRRSRSTGAAIATTSSGSPISARTTSCM